MGETVKLRPAIKRFAEAKTGKGKLTGPQMEWMYEVHKHGGLAFVFHNLEELEAAITEAEMTEQEYPRRPIVACCHCTELEAEVQRLDGRALQDAEEIVKHVSRVVDWRQLADELAEALMSAMHYVYHNSMWLYLERATVTRAEGEAALAKHAMMKGEGDADTSR